MNAIETHALTRRFGAHTAVDGLDLTVRQGELFALLGVNGAGKTTTLRMLSGLLQPTGGEADILGFRLTQQSQEIKRRINLSPQETAVAPNLTVRENLELIAGIYGASRREAAQRAAETIAEFHLGEVERSLTVLDGAVLVLSAVEGVQAQTRLLWRALEKMGIPTLLVVNKVDRAGCDIPGVLSCAALRAQFHGGTADSLFVVDDSGFWVAAPLHSISAASDRSCAVIRLWTERTVTDNHISGRWDADDFSYIAIGDIGAARALAITQ